MSPTFAIRPVLAVLMAVCTAACGAVEADSARFENMARAVSEVPVSLDRPGAPARTRSAKDIGLRPAEPLRVQVMEPHDLWDARDGLAPAVARAAAPIVADAAVQEVRRRAADLRPATLPARRGGSHLVQLGAFSSRAAAESAWATLRRGPAGQTLSTLQPRFEPVSVGGRDLVRLKVSAPASAAEAICRAARIDDPWCRRGA